MVKTEINSISEEIRDEFLDYVNKKFGNGHKSRIKALEEALKDWISKEKHSLELLSLIEDLDNNDEINAPRHAAHALRNFDDKKSVNALIKALKSEEVHIRRRAALSLGHIGDESSVKHLIKCLSDSDSGVRDNAVKSLAGMGNVSLKHLMESLHDRNEHIRAGALMAFNKMEILENLTDLNYMLLELLDDEDSVVRRRAVKSLETMGYADDKTTSGLIKALDDEDLLVRQNALITLGKVGNKDAIEYIIRATSDEDPRIREKAEQAWESMKERIHNNDF